MAREGSRGCRERPALEGGPPARAAGCDASDGDGKGKGDGLELRRGGRLRRAGGAVSERPSCRRLVRGHEVLAQSHRREAGCRRHWAGGRFQSHRGAMDAATSAHQADLRGLVRLQHCRDHEGHAGSYRSAPRELSKTARQTA